MSKDARTTLGLVAIVIILAVAAAISEARSARVIPLVSDSAEPTGAKALLLWLESLDYFVSDQTLSNFEVPPGVSTVLMLEPTTGVTSREFTRLDQFVGDGGTLVLVAGGFNASDVMGHYSFTVSPEFAETSQVIPSVPRLRDVIDWDSAELAPNFVLDPERSDYVTLLALDDQPVAVSIAEGRGQIILTTLTDAFSNSGIRRDGNGPLILNLIGLSDSVDNGTIWFDEWHHGDRGFSEATILGPYAWLRRTNAGRAVIYLFFLTAALLLWRGRRFGRPVPLPDANLRRAPVEYVTAIANLNRRSGERATVLADYRLRLKRKLGARYHIDPALPDGDYLVALQRANPSLDHAEIQKLLYRLNQVNMSENELVQTIRDISEHL